MHDGFIDGFAAIKRDLALAVGESLFAEIKGQADTEVLFYLALTVGLEDDPPDAVAGYRVREGMGRARASSTRPRALSRPPMGRACGGSASPARASHGRCS